MRIWGKIWKNNHLLRDTTIEDFSDDTRTHKVFHALDEICLEFDLGKPIWLDSNIREFQKHSSTKFRQDNFIEEIEQEVLVMFDEFDKTFGNIKAADGMANPQTELLTLFDGLAQGKKLYVITCNNLNTLSDYLVNRPGRFHYHFRFDYPTDSEITEYMRDKLHKEYYGEISKVIAFSKRVSLNYDCLRAIAFELNTGLQFQEAIKDMNILHINNTVYIATLYTKDGKKDTEEKSLDLFDKTSNHSLYFTIDGKWFYTKFSGVDVRYDFDRHIDFVDGKDVEIIPDEDYADLTKEEKKKYENIKIDRIVFARKEEKGLHYNLSV